MNQPIFITKKCYQTILRWSLCTKKEINILCFGQKRHITKTVRVRNVEKYARHSTSMNDSEYRYVISAHKNHFTLIAEGHNHHAGPAHPSKGDVEALPIGHTEIICCAKSKTITAWKIHRTWKQTLSHGRIQLITKEKP